MTNSTSPSSKEPKKTLLVGFLVGVSLSVLACFGVTVLFNDRISDHIPAQTVEQKALVEDRGRSTIESVTFQDISQLENSTQIRQSLHLFLNGKKSSDLVKFIDLASNLDDSRQKFVIQNTLFSHLTQIDPHESLAQVWEQKRHRQKELLAIVFANWASINLEAAVSAADKLPPSFKLEALRSILFRRIDLSDSERTLITNKLENQLDAKSLLSEVKISQLLDQPMQALAVIVGDEVEDTDQEDLLVQIASAWINQKGTAGYSALFKQLEVFESDLGNWLAETIVEQVVVRDPLSAWENVGDLSRPTELAVSAAIIRTMSMQDLQQTSDFLATIQDSELQSIGYERFVMQLAKEVPTETISNLQLVPREHQKSLFAYSIRELVKRRNVNEAIRLLLELNSQDEDIEDAKWRLIQAWSIDDPKGTLEWMRTSTQSELSWSWSRSDWTLVIQKLALEDASAAMKFARTHEFSSITSQQLQTSVIETLANQGRFVEARRALSEMSDKANEEAYSVLGLSLVDFDRTDEIIELADELPETGLKRYFLNVSRKWFFTNPDQLLESLAQFPNKSVRAAVAQDILDLTRRGNQFYSPEQLDHLSEFLLNTMSD